MEITAENGATTAVGEKSDRCSNCFRKFTETSRPSKEFYYNFIENGAPTSKIVSMSDALREIYHWRLFGFPQSDLDEKFSTVRVCGTVCGVALATLYRALKVFDALTHSDSQVNSLTKKTLERFISCATTQTLVENSVDPKSNPSVMTKTKKSRNQDGIGIKILNRPVTQYLTSVDKGTTEITLQEPLIGYLDPNDYQVLSGDGQNAPILVQIQNDSFLVTDDGKLKFNEHTEAIDDTQDDGDWAESEGLEEKESVQIPKPYLCQHCGAGLTSRQGLKTHELLTHKVGTGKEKVFTCHHCGKEFFYEYLLRNHLTRHATERDFKCSSCDLRFKGRIHLRQHIKDVHDSSEKRYACKICPNKSFKHQRTLWDHNKSLHGNKGKKLTFVCQYGCGSTTSRSRSLLHHHRICRKKPREDTVVDEAVKSIGGSTLSESELARLDDGGKRLQIYACTWDCGKVFTTKAYRSRHSNEKCRKRENKSSKSSAEDSDSTYTPEVKYRPGPHSRTRQRRSTAKEAFEEIEVETSWT